MSDAGQPREVNRVRYVQTGGFAGLKMVADVDRASLPHDEAATFDRLVAAALADRSKPASNPRARDGQHHEVTITHDGATTVLSGSDPELSPALAALVTTLQRHAEPSR